MEPFSSADAAGSTPRDAAGSTPRDAAGSTPRDAAGSTPRDAAGSTPLEAAGSTPHHTDDRGAPRPESLALTAHDRATLLSLADAAIRRELWPMSERRDPVIESPTLREHHGVFVTVTVNGELNGCIGALWSDEPLYESVARLARQAAFADPRLPRLTIDEYPATEVKIAILTPPTAIDADTEAVVLNQLRPGVDGLVIAAGRRQATFLPAVWRSLPEPADFLAHLKAKAGIPTAAWPRGMHAWRYQTIDFSSRPGSSEHDVS